MLLEEVLAEIRIVANKVNDLTTDVSALKQREKERRGVGVCRACRGAGAPYNLTPVTHPDRVWAWDDPSYGRKETSERKRMTTYRYITRTRRTGSRVASWLESLEKTHRLLTNSCMCSMSNKLRK